jgi:gamma-glutamyltranspeptidase/glutathione hydrolase
MAADRITGAKFATRSEVIATSGMVATSHPLAAQIGIDILKQGGSAVDAAIAVNAALGLMEPTGSGIGGDLFAIVWDADEQKMYGLNASGPAPRALTLRYVRAKKLERMPFEGPLPWTVPGCVAGWGALHEKFGELPFDQLLAPAIRYAEQGFPLTELIAYYWDRSVKKFAGYENFQQVYAPLGRAPRKGEVFKNPDLAATYRAIAEHGPDTFYKGEIAERIVEYSDSVGGLLGQKDLSRFEPEWVEPVNVPYRGYGVWELPPNGQGIAALQMLRMLGQLDVEAMGFGSADHLHTMIEVKKIVYEDRARHYADPRFADVPVSELISWDYAEKRLKLLKRSKAARQVPAGDPRLDKGDTVYLTVVDKDRNAVSLIQSNYFGFGSGNVPDGLGFCIQDRGALFSLDRKHKNALEPGKRPFHTIIPALVTKEGEPVFSFGVMGGAMQPQGHVQILTNILDFGMSVQEAGDAPRWRHGGSSQPDERGRMEDGGQVYLESGFDGAVVEELKSRGHRIMPLSGGFGGYQGIWIDHDNGTLIGASESRKDGCAIGY